MIAWAWNYDFDQWNIPSLSPAINVYAGLSNGDNIGTGFQFLGITHFSYAKYFGEDVLYRGFYYLHLNQPVSTIYNNPYFELGGGIITDEDGIYHTLSAGLGFGHGMSYGMLGVWQTEIDQRGDAKDFIQIWRLIPTLNYTAVGPDVSISLSYHHGKDKQIYDNLVNAITNCQDTLLYIPAQEIQFVWDNGEVVSWTYHAPEIRGESRYYHDRDLDLEATWAPLIRGTSRIYSSLYIGGQRFLGNLDEVYSPLKLGGDLLITKYPESALNRLRRPKSHFRDLSIGFAVMQFR